MRAIRACTVWGTEHYDEVVRAVLGAKRSVWIATANLKELMVEPASGRSRRYHSVMVELDRLSQAGVELRMLHAGLPSRPFRDEFDAWPRLVAGGLQLRQCPRVHMKIVVVDGAWAYLGSANWTGAGLGAKGEHRRNFELGIVTDDCALIDDAQRRFDALWRGHECAQCRLRSECEAPLDLELRAASKARGRGKPSAVADASSGSAVVRIGGAPARSVRAPRSRLPASRTRP
jgi:phosphatidylserine/phosphatidylglycerophosphate/cardiolipin synthase-like enzyme